MTYNLASPIDTVFNTIQEFQDLCKLVNKAKNDNKLVDMAYIIFQNSGAFTDSLKAWNKRATANLPTTFTAMRTFFCDEHKDLAKVNALSVTDTKLQNNLLQEIKAKQDTMAEDLEAKMQAHFLQALSLYADMEDTKNQDPGQAGQINALNKSSKNKLLQKVGSFRK